uniref:Uncharacterized protein n=1 Tax=Ditylenchus dipsaci TaxID=166011 RepID=A0A915E913_9BILA
MLPSTAENKNLNFGDPFESKLFLYLTASPDVSVTSKAHLLCSHVCVDVQYSSKKFGGKFLSVGFERQVKDGREYKIWIREPAQKVAVIAE